VCFFRSAETFKERYVTLGFNDSAKLDDGNLWPISYARDPTTRRAGRPEAFAVPYRARSR
jgi:hypothetical protein